MATLNDFIARLKAKSATRIFKIELLDSDENVVREITNKVLDGNITISDETGCRRTASITFDNSSGDFLPSSDGDIWMNTKFKISTGLIMEDGSEYYISRGIFLCSEPEIVSSFDGEASCSIQFLDKFSLLNAQLGGTLETTYKITAGTSISAAVTSILSVAGDIKLPIIEPTAETTPYTLIANAGDTYGDLLVKLAQMLSWTCYYDEEGYFRFEPSADIDTTGSSWDFATDEITYISSRHRFEFTKVYNYIQVVGSNINGSIVKASASDTNVTSPTRISLIGKKVKVIEDDLISSVGLAQDRANAELQSAISLVEVTDLDTMPVDIINGGQIITVTDSISGLSGDRFLVKSVTFPLTVNSGMSISAWKGRSLTD